VAYSADLSVPGWPFHSEQVTVNCVLYSLCLVVDTFADLVVIMTFEVLHVLSVINGTVLNTSDFLSGTAIIYRQALARALGYPIRLSISYSRLLLHSRLR